MLTIMDGPLKHTRPSTSKQLDLIASLSVDIE